MNCVIVKDLSRFGRNYIDTGKYLERYFPNNDVRFISITDNIDSMKQQQPIKQHRLLDVFYRGSYSQK